MGETQKELERGEEGGNADIVLKCAYRHMFFGCFFLIFPSTFSTSCEWISHYHKVKQQHAHKHTHNIHTIKNLL